MRNSLLRSLVVALCLFTFSGCGIIDYFYLPPPEDTAQELFESANEYMREKDYAAAIERFNKLKDAYPFSPYVLEAELSLADAYFMDGEYASAADAYKEFESMHPRHPAIPYVLYQIGQSRLKSFVSVDRPTTEIQEGYDYFRRLSETFPNSEYTPPAIEAMVECRKLMAEHELYIADVFWHMEQYGSAWRRYVYVSQNFKDVKEVSEHAEQKSISAYYKYREEQSEEVRQQREGTWKKWFRWL